MASLMQRVQSLANSRQGQQLVSKARTLASDPKNRARVEQAARSLRRRRER